MKIKDFVQKYAAFASVLILFHIAVVSLTDYFEGSFTLWVKRTFANSQNGILHFFFYLLAVNFINSILILIAGIYYLVNKKYIKTAILGLIASISFLYLIYVNRNDL